MAITEQILEEPVLVPELTQEELKQISITDGIVERSYLHSIKEKDKEELGEIRLGEISVGISLDPDNVPVLTIASNSDYLVEQFQDAVHKPHIERPAIMELPDEERDRVVRIECVNVLSYLQKREKARTKEIELMNEYESELSNQFE